MVIILTGATSFIGKRIIRYLYNKDNRIIAVGRKDSYFSDESGVEYIKSSMAEFNTLDLKIPHCDIFINLAWAGTGHGERDDAGIQQCNVKHTLDAICSAKRMGCKIFVEAGSQAEYGIQSSLMNENAICNPISEYGKAKLAVKEKAFKLCRDLGMTYIHLRIFSLFGETDHPWTLVMSSIDKMLGNEDVNLSKCEQSWNFMYVDDAAQSIVKLCNSYVNSVTPTQEVYNIASVDTKPLKDFVERIRILTGSKSYLHYGVIKPNKIVSLYPDITKLKKSIGEIPHTNFDEVIKNIIKLKKYNQ